MPDHVPYPIESSEGQIARKNQCHREISLPVPKACDDVRVLIEKQEDGSQEKHRSIRAASEVHVQYQADNEAENGRHVAYSRHPSCLSSQPPYREGGRSGRCWLSRILGSNPWL